MIGTRRTFSFYSTFYHINLKHKTRKKCFIYTLNFVNTKQIKHKSFQNSDDKAFFLNLF